MAFISHYNWPSSEIRGRQIARKLGASFHDTSGGDDWVSYDNDEPIVFVKCVPVLTEENLKRIASHVFFDIVDSDVTLAAINEHLGDSTIITMTELGARYVKGRVTNPVVVLPQHHCNFEGVQRTREDISIVGYVGSKLCLHEEEDIIRDKMAKAGLEFKMLFVEDNSISREEVCDFYKTIDIQLTFRKPDASYGMPPELKDTLKIANAGSFKIPTVGYPELIYEENADGLYYPVKSIDEAVDVCNELKANPSMHSAMAILVWTWSQNFYIERIASNYKKVFEGKGLRWQTILH